MKLIVGLGNPGNRYATTRHNIGWMALDHFARNIHEPLKEDHKSFWVKTKIANTDVLLQKPMTFMNHSGEAIQSLAAYFKITVENICVLHDDMDIPLGAVRLKIGGGDGGHNGLKSTTQCLHDESYARIRLGIGRPVHPSQDPADFVLTPFSKDEQVDVALMIDKATQAINAFITGAFPKLMNQFNQREKK